MIIDEHRVTACVRLSDGIDRIISGFVVRTPNDVFVRLEKDTIDSLDPVDRGLATEAIYDAWIEVHGS